MNRTSMLMGLFAILLSSAAAAQRAEHEGQNVTSRVVEMRKLGRGFLGVHLTPLTPELRVHFGVPEDTGVMVSRVEADGPAEAAGIQVGDILASVDGERIDSPRELARAVRGKNEGELVTVELYRDGGLQSYTVTVSERERRVIDLAGGYRFLPGDELPDHDMVIRVPGVPLDPESIEAFENAMQGLEEQLASPEWHERIERFQELDFTSIQERMEEVERRLEELEQELNNEERDER